MSKHYEMPKFTVWVAGVALVASLVTNIGTIFKPAMDFARFQQNIESKISVISNAEAATSSALLQHNKDDQLKEVKLAEVLGRMDQKLSSISDTQKSMWEAIRRHQP